MWNKLSGQFQAILQQAADESVWFQRKLWAQKQQENLEAVEKAGVEIMRPDKEPFRVAVESLWAEFDGTEIGELAKRIQQVQ
jgi:TRAP-type C4-dicarboxylate transport system substrate-binding protein